MPNWICLACDNDVPIEHECQIGPDSERDETPEPPPKPRKSPWCCILWRMGQKRHTIQCQFNPFRRR